MEDLFRLDGFQVGFLAGKSVGTPPAADISARAVLWILDDLRAGIFAGDFIGAPPIDFWLDFWLNLRGGRIKGG